MGRVYIEDVTSIALLYNYRATNSISMMLSQAKIKEYAQMIGFNLDEMESDFSRVYPVDYSKLIYFNAQDENGNWYSILKPDIDIEVSEDVYERQLLYTPDLYKAATMENALAALDIEFVDNKMQKIEHKKSKQFSLGEKK